MKITSIKTFRTSTPVHKTAGTNWLFVKIGTDSGITGWGEGSLQYKDAALEAEINDFGNYLIGKDPRRTEDIWTSLYRRVTWSGGAVTMSAIAAIDLALWDIKAKALGVPVYELAGGPTHDSMQVYANGWFEGLDEPDPDSDGTRQSAELYAKGAAAIKAAGWRALKFYPFNGPQVVTPQRIAHGIEVVRAVREAVGPDMEIGIDIRARLDVWSAGRVARKLEEFDIAWMEEPVLWDNPKAFGAFARSVNVPISTGEQLYNRWDFEPLLEEEAVGIIQPDICHCGGFSELLKIAHAAATHYVSVAPHNSNGPLSSVASLHLDMSIANSFMQEIFVSHFDRGNELLTNPLVIENGRAKPPAGPGWGTDIDEDALAKYPPVEFTQIESEPYLKF